MLLSPKVVPTLNGESFVEKPPLYYWTVAAVFSLVGKASAAAARSVSAIASFATLLLVYFWGRREFSSGAGVIAALGLATSVQFMISSHWVLIDPMLMLFTTVAAWAGWEIVQGRRGVARLLAFYGALGLALWTKGLIGPVLLAAGFGVYALSLRSGTPLRRLHPVAGVLLMVVATVMLAALIYFDAGAAAVREWLWVNHVQRFIEPAGTGHVQPWYYYLYTVPTVVFPWWLPFAQSLRPSRWRGGAERDTLLTHYLGAMSLGMVLVLSASATKRGIYLLPALPLLMLLFTARALEWWRGLDRPLGRQPAWWGQAVLCLVCALGPTSIALVYLHSVDPLALGFLAGVALIALALGAFTVLDRRVAAARLLGVLALSGVVGLLVVAARLAAPEKDMRPFVEWLDTQLPSGQPVYALGTLDETLYGIVPFVTGRSVRSVTMGEIAAEHPSYVLVQDKEGGRTAPELERPYELARERSFGPGRYFAIWHDTAAPSAESSDSSGHP